MSDFKVGDKVAVRKSKALRWGIDHKGIFVIGSITANRAALVGSSCLLFTDLMKIRHSGYLKLGDRAQYVGPEDQFRGMVLTVSKEIAHSSTYFDVAYEVEGIKDYIFLPGSLLNNSPPPYSLDCTCGVMSNHASYDHLHSKSCGRQKYKGEYI